ncbi:MAG: DUF6429 family protein [Phycisphaerae bacterium]
MSKRHVSESSQLDFAKIDDAVLALLHLNAEPERLGGYTVTRAWKSLNWDALSRLHEAGLIGEPRSTAKSVVLDEEGVRRAELACERLFGQGASEQRGGRVDEPRGSDAGGTRK